MFGIQIPTVQGFHTEMTYLILLWLGLNLGNFGTIDPIAPVTQVEFPEFNCTAVN